MILIHHSSLKSFLTSTEAYLMSKTERKLWIWGALYIATAIALGAFGAHAVKSRVSPDALAWWETAADYQRLHGLGLLALATLWPRVSRFSQKKLMTIAYLFIAGGLFFCGSLYAMTLTNIRVLGAITPIGGSLWILAWLWLAWTLYRDTDQKTSVSQD